MATRREALEGTDMQRLYANLAFIRTKRGVSYASLALRAGMTERNAYMIVTGKQGARIGTICNLADALRVPMGDLFMEPLRFQKKYAKAKKLGGLTIVEDGKTVATRTYHHSRPDQHFLNAS